MANQAEEILLQFTVALNDRGDIVQAKKLMEDYENASGRSINTLKSMEKQLSRLGDTAREVGTHFKDLGDRAGEISKLGDSIRQMSYALGQTGEAFFSKQKQGIDEYVRAYGNVETVSARYNQSLKSIEAANIRIGQVGASALAPQMEAQAASAERWAHFLESNPWIAGVGANIGNAVQQTTAAASQVGQMTFALGGLLNLPVEMEKASKQFGEVGSGLSRMFSESLAGGSEDAFKAAAVQATAAASQQEAAAQQMLAGAEEQAAAAEKGAAGTAGGGGELIKSLQRFQSGEAAAAVTQETAAAQQATAATEQVTAATVQKASGLQMGKAFGSLGGGLSVFGGIVAGLAVSDALANSGANKSAPVKGLNDAISSATGGIGGFQFQSIAQVGTMLGQLFTMWAAGVGVMLNVAEDFIHGVTKTFADVQVGIARAVGNMFGGNLIGAGEKAAALVKANFEGMGAYATRTTDHMSAFGKAAGELSGVFDDGASAAQKSAEAWPQAVEAYAQYSKQNQEAQQSYNIEVSRANAENDRQATLALDNFNHNKKRSEDEFYRQNMLADQQRQHQKDVEDAEIAHQRLQEDKQLGHTREMEDADRQHQISKQLEQFNYQESITESNYLKQRLLAARDFSIQMADAEYQYQKQAVRDLEDHDDRVLQLGKQNDAMGIVLEMRQYEKDRRRKAEDHNYDLSKSNEQFARQQADQEREFAYERQLRLDEMARNQDLEKKDIEYRRGVQDDDIKYQRGVQDKETQYKRDQADKEYDWDKRKRADDFAHQQDISQQEFDREQGLTATQNALRLGEMKDQYEREKAKRSLQFEDQLNQLDGALLGETKQRDDYYKIMGDNLKTWLKDQTDMISGKGTGEYKAPTYVRPGDTSQINNPNVVFLPGVGVVPVGTTQTGSNKTRARAEGGYAKFGKYTLGEHGDEFVVKADATRQLERILGQRLTQEGLLAAVSTQRASGSYNAHMAQSFTFNGMPNSAQSQDLVNSIRQAISHDLAVSLKRAASRNI